MSEGSKKVTETTELEESAEAGSFSFTGLEHPTLAKYQPVFMAAGGEHVVYEIPGHPDIVVKAELHPTIHQIRQNARQGLPLDHITEMHKLLARAYLQEQTLVQQKMVTAFGREHLPQQKAFLKKVPVSEAILKAAKMPKEYPGPREVWSMIKVQKREKELADDHFTLTFEYAEGRTEDPELYRRATKALVWGEESDEEIEVEGRDYYLQAQDQGELFKLLYDSEDDVELREQLAEFTQKAIAYTQNTGEILDLAGEDNVAFVKKGGHWTYRLIDAAAYGKYAESSQLSLRKLAQGKELSEEEAFGLYNTVNYVRTINGTALFLGLPDRIKIIPPDLQDVEIDLQPALLRELARYQAK